MEKSVWGLYSMIMTYYLSNQMFSRLIVWWFDDIPDHVCIILKKICLRRHFLYCKIPKEMPWAFKRWKANLREMIF